MDDIIKQLHITHQESKKVESCLGAILQMVEQINEDRERIIKRLKELEDNGRKT